MPIASNLYASKFSPAPPTTQGVPYIDPETPTYMIRDGHTYIGNRYLEEGKIIEWLLEPNLQMQPVNAPAADAYEKMLKKLDGLGEAYKKKSNTYQNGQPYIYMAELPRRQHMIDMARDPARKADLYWSIAHKKAVPIYPANRGQSSALRVLGEEENVMPSKQQGPVVGQEGLKVIE